MEKAVKEHRKTGFLLPGSKFSVNLTWKIVSLMENTCTCTSVTWLILTNFSWLLWRFICICSIQLHQLYHNLSIWKASIELSNTMNSIISILTNPVQSSILFKDVELLAFQPLCIRHGHALICLHLFCFCIYVIFLCLHMQCVACCGNRANGLTPACYPV